jgi:hypothetical protein
MNDRLDNLVESRCEALDHRDDDEGTQHPRHSSRPRNGDLAASPSSGRPVDDMPVHATAREEVWRDRPARRSVPLVGFTSREKVCPSGPPRPIGRGRP